jgi:2-keto-3-deoxy-L-rhamnonate aldolase RhmA
MLILGEGDVAGSARTYPLTKKNRTKQMLREGKTVVGTMLTENATPETARMMKAAGFDFIFVDTEHGPFSFETVANVVRGAKSVGLSCFVRVTDPEYHLIARTLDAGAQGLLIPRVETRPTVDKIVSAAKYPPVGERGYGPRTIVTDFEPMSVKDFTAEQNEDTMIILQIEKKDAIQDIEDLVSVKGVDAALIGPNDLSISMGVPGEYENPIMVDAIQRVVTACEKHGVASGTHVRDLKNLLFWKNKGMRLLTYSTDANLLLGAASDAVKEIRRSL